MKKYYVYELVNLMGTVEYVGETTNPKDRFRKHTRVKPGAGTGTFYKRGDIFMSIVTNFDNRKEAYNYQCDLQKEYGLITDKEIQSVKAKYAFKAQNVELVCPHCNKIGIGRVMYRYHFDRCSHKKTPLD